MVPPAPDSRSVMARAYSWAGRIITVAMEMVVPGVVGVWIDKQLGTIALFTVIGFGGGLVLGMWHLLKMTSRKGEPTEQAPQRRQQ